MLNYSPKTLIDLENLGKTNRIDKVLLWAFVVDAGSKQHDWPWTRLRMRNLYILRSVVICKTYHNLHNILSIYTQIDFSHDIMTEQCSHAWNSNIFICTTIQIATMKYWRKITNIKDFITSVNSLRGYKIIGMIMRSYQCYHAAWLMLYAKIMKL